MLAAYNGGRVTSSVASSFLYTLSPRGGTRRGSREEAVLAGLAGGQPTTAPAPAAAVFDDGGAEPGKSGAIVASHVGSLLQCGMAPAAHCALARAAGLSGGVPLARALPLPSRGRGQRVGALVHFANLGAKSVPLRECLSADLGGGRPLLGCSPQDQTHQISLSLSSELTAGGLPTESPRPKGVPLGSDQGSQNRQDVGEVSPSPPPLRGGLTPPPDREVSEPKSPLPPTSDEYVAYGHPPRVPRASASIFAHAPTA